MRYFFIKNISLAVYISQSLIKMLPLLFKTSIILKIIYKVFKRKGEIIMNKKLLILAICSLALVACNKNDPSTSEESSMPSVSTSETSQPTSDATSSDSAFSGATSDSTTPEPIEDDVLIQKMIETLIEDNNYTIVVESLADEETFVTKILPNAFYTIHTVPYMGDEEIAYAENDEGIFGYTIEDEVAVPTTAYLENDEGEKLHGLYTTQIEDNWGDLVYLAHSFNLVDADNFSELTANEDNSKMFDIDIQAVLPLLDEMMAQSYMYDNNASSHISLSENKTGLVIEFKDSWGSLTRLTVSDIGTTAIDEITTYLEDGNGALEDGGNEQLSLKDKIKALLDLQNYVITDPSVEKFYRIVTENFVVDGFTSEGFIKLPANDDRGAGIYDFNLTSSTPELGDRNYSISSLSEITGVFPSALIDETFMEMEGKLISDGSLESMINLMNYSNNFDSALLEEGKFIGAAEIELNEEFSIINITGYVYNMETLEFIDETISFTLTQFGNSTFGLEFLDDFYNSLI